MREQIILWLARRSKKLDLYFTKLFWKKQKRMIDKITESIDLDKNEITFKQLSPLQDTKGGGKILLD
jgi:hypothetical protein